MTGGACHFLMIKKEKEEAKTNIIEKEENDLKDTAIDGETKNDIRTKIVQIVNSGMGIKDYNPTDDDYLLLGWPLLEELFKNESITEDRKTYIAVNSIEPEDAIVDLENISDDRIKKEIPNFASHVSWDNELHVKQIKADSVAKLYKNLFGGEITHQDVSGCPLYIYYPAGNIYYYVSECGGTTADRIYITKRNYQKKKDIITVDVTPAFLYYNRAESYSIFSETQSYDDLEKNRVTPITTIPISEWESFKIDDSNKKDYNTYRFTFKKDSLGNYYFYEIHKMFSS